MAPFFGCATSAQTPPAGALDEFRPSERQIGPPELEREKPQPRFELPPIPMPSEKAPLSAAPTFLLREVVFQGNTVFTSAELRHVIKTYIGKRVSTEQLQEIRRRVSLHYLNAGFINSGAIIPDQEVANGVVTLRIIEGTLSQIDVRGAIHIEPEYISDRLRLGAGPPLNVNELQERVRIVLRDPLVKRIDVRLSPGTRLGDAKLDVNVEEEKRFTGRISVSNSRPPSIGSFETRADLEARDLTGWGDAHHFSYARTRGLQDISFKTEMPVTSRDTKLSLRAARGTSDVVEEPFNIIDVESESRDYEIALTQPVYRSATAELTFGLEFNWRESRTFLLGVPFSFSEGPVNGVSQVRVLRFVQEWIDRTRDQVLAIRSTFSKGLDIFAATSNPSPIADGRFLSWLGQAQWVRRVLADNQIILRGDMQLAPDRLLPLEKYSLGGIASVRGYRENQIVKDQGYSLTIEGRIPVVRFPLPWIGDEPQDGIIQLAPFFDYGRAWDRDTANPGPTTLYSVGLGLIWRITDDVNATLYVAHAFRSVPEAGEDSLQDDGIHFRVAATVF